MIVNGWILCSCKESPERTDKYYSSVDRGKCSKSVRVRVDKTSLESEKPLEDWGERVPAVFRSLARFFTACALFPLVYIDREPGKG